MKATLYAGLHPQQRHLAGDPEKSNFFSGLFGRTMGLCLGCFIAFGSGLARSDEVELREEQFMRIHCSLPPAETWRSLQALRTMDINPADQEYSYDLWLPRGYLDDPDKHWPVLFLGNPVENRGLHTMRDWVVSNGVIVVKLMQAGRGASYDVAIGNFLAAHDDVMQRCRIQDGLKFATGFSAGARISSVAVQLRPGFAGLILQGAGLAQYRSGGRAPYLSDGIRSSRWIGVAMVMGSDDRNMSEVPRVSPLLGSSQYKVFEFDGGHTWAPPEAFAEAADWLMRYALYEGPVNPALENYYAEYFWTLVRSAQAEEDPWKRYSLISEAAALADARGIGRSPDEREILSLMSSESRRLRSDPAVSHQLRAASVLGRIEEGGARMRPQALRQQLQSFLDQYGNTEAAANARTMLTELPEQ